jgi:hypothetical protein
MRDDLAEAIARDGAELDRLELVEHVPELQRENAVVVERQYGRYAPPPFRPTHYDLLLELPDHPAVSRYRTDLMFADELPLTDLRTARARFNKCAEQFYTLCGMRPAQVEWSDGGKAVSLRAIIDAEHAMVAAYNAAITAEARELHDAIRHTVVDGYFKTGRTVRIDGVRVPIVKKVRP